MAPWLDLVRKLGLLAGALCDELPVSLSVQARGELAAEDVAVLRLSALRGLFSAVIEEPVTFVNARPSPKNAESSPRSALPPKAPTTAAWSTCGQWPPTARWSTSRARCRAPAGAEDRADQRSQLRSARRGHQPDHQLHRSARCARQDRHAARRGGVNIHAAQLSEDTEGPGATILLRLNRDVPEDVRAAISAAVDANKLEVVDLS
ncbi:D-3-phosphoglycerate dehydrogenase domain protein [Mycobacterium xenopi 3993]|nr:D-3-phosphoglycerate dehydrogenase domain protein [Mycobacterium xenopi 3993]